MAEIDRLIAGIAPPDIVGSIYRGLQTKNALQEMQMQREEAQRQQQARNLLGQITSGADGKQEMNKLAQTSPELYMKLQNQILASQPKYGAPTSVIGPSGPMMIRPEQGGPGYLTMEGLQPIPEKGNTIDPNKGYMFVDPTNPRLGVKSVPGGKAWKEERQQEESKKLKMAATKKKFENVTSLIGKAIDQTGFYTTGLTGAVVGNVPGTDPYDLRRTIDTIKANIGFDRLQQMREESPTGGALGQVAVQELTALQSVLGSLDANQDSEQVLENLERVQEHYNNWYSASTGKPNKKVREMVGEIRGGGNQGVSPQNTTIQNLNQKYPGLNLE